MKPRHRRFAWVAAGLVALGIAAALVLNALGSNMSWFITPTEVAEGKAPAERNFRIGGLVEPGSLQRADDRVGGTFRVTDGNNAILVSYTGILPDLFKEGRGVVAQGRLTGNGGFDATEVLAKHDENYMPPEAAEALERAGHPVNAGAQAKQQ
ncbi:MAG: cytochrome c maturation protein CcmE [Burkholderiaceae bacterium]